MIVSIFLTLLPSSVCICSSLLTVIGLMSHWYVFYLFIFLCLLQVQKQNYRQEKKRAAKELFSALKDPSVVIMSNWLKVRQYCTLQKC